MSVKFVLGRSGSGKTHYCLGKIREQLLASAEGAALLLLVPEQATFQMEQALVSDGRLRGFHRVLVLSFERLARQVLQDRPASLLPVLSESGKQMLLKHLVQQQRERLFAFSRSGSSQGFVAKLSEMIRECRHYEKGAKQLLAQAEAVEQASEPLQQPLAEKLRDLSCLIQAYEEAIAGRYLDPDDYLNLMRARVGQVEFLAGAQLWIDGFAGFTPQQYGVLETLVSQAAQTRVSLCLDPVAQAFEALDKGEGEVDAFDLFAPILETCGRLKKMFVEQGCEIEAPVLLPEPGGLDKVMPRFADCEPLGRLEHLLFLPVAGGEKAEEKTDWFGRGAQHVSAIATEGVVVVRAGQRRGEVEAAAQQILRLCRERGYRFGEIAVILRDFSDYQPLLEAIFSDYGIAYFMDQRQSVRHHPLVNLLGVLLEVFASDFSNASVLDYLKSDLVGMAREDVYHLENIVLAQGVRLGGWMKASGQKAARLIKPGKEGAVDAERLEEWRVNYLAPLVKLRDVLAAAGQDVRTQVRVLYEHLETLGAGSRLAQWGEQAEKEGQLNVAQMHRQVYQQVIAVLEELAEVLGDEVMTLEEMGEILSGTLNRLSLGMVPPSLDQVLVGTIERSRHPQIRAALLLGVNEGRFPQVEPVDSFLNEDQRGYLSRRGFDLAPGRGQRLLDERFLGYIALTRAREFLWVSFAATEAQGEALNPSMLIDAVGEVVDDGAFVDLPDDGGPDLSAIYTPRQLGEQLAQGLSKEGADEQRAIWQGLARWGLAQESWREVLTQSLGGLVYRNAAQLEAGLAGRFFAGEVTGSISRLESFAACPYRHFTQYMLGVGEREELKLAAIDLGSFYHDALCDLFGAMKKQGTGWLKVSEDELQDLVGVVTESLLSGGGRFAALRHQSSRNRAVLERAVGALGGLCRALREGFCVSGFEQVDAEMHFGPQAAVAGLRLMLEVGRPYMLEGVIDRIDLCRRDDGSAGLSVVDYKLSGRGFDFAEFYHGLSLQLVSYLLVVQEVYAAEAKAKQAAAAVYVPLVVRGEAQSGEAPMAQLEQGDTVAAKRHKANGLIHEGWFEQMDQSAAPGTSSKYYSVRLNKEGQCYTKMNRGVVSDAEMERILRYGHGLLARLADELVSGKIAIEPYRYKNQTACQYCAYRSLCRFDGRVDGYRGLAEMTKEAVLARIGGQA